MSINESRRTNQSPPVHATVFHPAALLRLCTVAGLAGIQRTTIYEKVKAGKFPAPVKLGSRCTRWRAGDVIAWLEAQE